LPWKENQKKISCIPECTYKAIATRRSSNGHYAIWLVDVPGRSEIMFHIGNSVKDIEGCIAPGKWKQGDYVNFVEGSKDTMDALQKHFPIGTELIVKIRKA